MTNIAYFDLNSTTINANNMKFSLLMLSFIFSIQTLIGQDSLRLYYQFENTLINAAADQYHGTGLSTIQYQYGHCRKAIIIEDTPSSGVSVSGEVFNDLTDFTVSALVKLDGFNSNNNLLSCANASLANEFIISYNAYADNFTDGWFFTIKGENYFFDENEILNDFKWHHIVAIRKDNQALLYIDGDQIGNPITVNSHALVVAEEGFIIGQDQDCVGGCFEADQNWHGCIDELKIFSKALEEDDLNNLHCQQDISSTLDPIFNTDIYPNPFGGTINIVSDDDQPKAYILTNVSGQVILKGGFQFATTLHLKEGMPSGIYLLKIIDETSDETVMIKRLIKQSSR